MEFKYYRERVKERALRAITDYAGGMEPKIIMERYKISRRTLYRYLKLAREGKV